MPSPRPRSLDIKANPSFFYGYGLGELTGISSYAKDLAH